MKQTLIALVLVVMLWCFYKQNVPIDQTSNKRMAQEYMSYLKIFDYNDSGVLKQFVQADYWEFQATAHKSELLNPKLQIYKPDGNTWMITAKQAVAWHQTLNDKISGLELEDRVLITRAATELNTDYLYYNPETELVSTERYVQMQQPGLFISGIGLIGNLAQNKVELLDDITTIYQQTSK